MTARSFKNAPGLRTVDSALERADEVRRTLSRLIVGSGAYRDDVLEITVSEPTIQDGKLGRSRTIIKRRKPAHGELLAIHELADMYAAQAKRSPDRWPNPAIEALMLQRDIADVDPLAELLSAPGWQIEDIPTGNPDGRPPISTEPEARQQLGEVASLEVLHHAIKAGRHRSPDQSRLLRALPNVLHRLSPRHAACSLSVSESVVHKIKSKPKEASVTEVLEEIRALRAEMAEVREDAAVTRRVAVETAERIRERFPLDAEVCAAVDQLIACAAP